MERSRQAGDEFKARAVKVRIKVVGIGDAGCKSAESLARLFSSAKPDGDWKPLFHEEDALRNLSFAAVNTDAGSLEKCSLSETLQLGVRLTHGLSAGGDPQVGRVAAQQAAEDLRGLIKASDLVVVLAGLGGGTGTGAAPLLARLARDQGACTLAAVEMPFDFEGQKRRQYAMEGYEALRSEADAVISIPKDKLFQSVDGRAGVLEAFRRATQLQAQIVAGLLGVSSGGVLRVEFATLKAALRKSRLLTTFGYGVGRGEKKHRQAVESLLGSPLLEKGRQLENADELIVGVTGGDWLKCEDVDELLTQLRRQGAGRARILAAASAMRSAADEISVAVFASSGSWRAAPPKTRFAGSVTLSAAAPRVTTEAVAGRIELQVHPQHSECPARVEGHHTGGDELDASSQTAGTGRVVRINAGSTGTINASLTAEQPAKIRSWDGTATASVEEVKSVRKTAVNAPAGERSAKGGVWEQGSLPLEAQSKGKFTGDEPLLLNGEDLDLPTYQRRGVKLSAWVAGAACSEPERKRGTGGT
jgi:cell division protein FtsZ